jgi:hypothetical protein
MPGPKTASTEQVNQALAALTGVREAAYCETVDEALTLVQDRSPVLARAPFNLGNAFMIHEQVPITSTLLFFRNDKFMRRLLGEAFQDSTCLMWDSHLKGKDALYVVRRYDQDDLTAATQYTGRLIKARPEVGALAVICGRDRDGGSVIAFQLRQLFA